MRRIRNMHALLPVNINMLRTMVQHRKGSRILMNKAKQFAAFMTHELNKIGVNYNPYQSDGSIKQVQTMVKEFTNVFAPNIDVCLLDTGDVSQKEKLKLVQKLVLQVNKIYGVNILIDTDPLNPGTPRTTQELCRNIIDMMSKISRVLTSDIPEQIKRNKEEIKAYQTIRDTLNQLFEKMIAEDTRGTRRERARNLMNTNEVRNVSVLNSLDKILKRKARVLIEQIRMYKSGLTELRSEANNKLFHDIDPALVRLYNPDYSPHRDDSDVMIKRTLLALNEGVSTTAEACMRTLNFGTHDDITKASLLGHMEEAYESARTDDD